MFRRMTSGRETAGCLAILLACVMSIVMGTSGCTSEPSTSPLPKLKTLKFRSDAGSPQPVTVVEDNTDSAYIRIHGDDDRSFYIHRTFVREEGDAHVLVSASTFFEKDEQEEHYFTLREFNRMRDKIPGLFMTHPSGTRVIAGWKTPAPFEYRGEMAWRVYECLKADCPGRNEGDEHGPLFILPDENLTPGADLPAMEKNRTGRPTMLQGRRWKRS